MRCGEKGEEAGFVVLNGGRRLLRERLFGRVSKSFK